MPRQPMLASGPRNAGVDQIIKAKRHWKVAAIALTHRLAELDLLTEWATATRVFSYPRWDTGAANHRAQLFPRHRKSWRKSLRRCATAASARPTLPRKSTSRRLNFDATYSA